MGVMLSAAGLLLLVMLHSSLVHAAVDAATERRDEVARHLAREGLAELPALLGPNGPPTQHVQVIDSRGKVVAAAGTASPARLVDRPLGPGQEYRSPLPGFLNVVDDNDLVVSAIGVTLPEGRYIVAVAASTSVQKDAVAAATWFMFAAAPVLLGITAAIMWTLVGRSLRPVERISRTVATINRHRLTERVEIPPTGDEIQHLASTMNDMLDRLEGSDRSQRHFVANASHELRSPLSTLTTGLEIAAADPSGGTWRQTAGILHAQALRMGLLVEDLLTLAKLDDEGLRFTMTDVDLDDVVHEEANRLRIVTRHAVTENLVPARISGDAVRLGQVLRNILANAERHAAAAIAVAVATDGTNAVVTVDNDGDRIPAAERGRIFDRFVRLDQSRSRESGGSGLGLAISKEIIAAHHGTIRATENGGGMTRLEITLPLQQSAG
ncbi:ATP-binding protein [Arthrobacter sp. I2-34]|uniref:histidine kinase n=1 Tax=Arthrobacter hankyongi TaxID=2904801 RepID=A0ABS9LAL1_9MICC|nr:ATP-binding protein [Arthrobacter hankyongi]MCG2623723.1 ATP-binding protein [Arthrobacter hankyongi]